MLTPLCAQHIRGRGSLIQKVDRLGQHLFCRLHHRQIGFVGALGFAHVHDFHQTVDIGQLHIALLVGIGVAGVVLTAEIALVGDRLAGLDQIGFQLAVEIVVNGGDLAAIGIGALTGEVELALAIFSAIVFMRSVWARMPEAATAMDFEKSITFLLSKIPLNVR